MLGGDAAERNKSGGQRDPRPVSLSPGTVGGAAPSAVTGRRPAGTVGQPHCRTGAPI